MHVETPSIAYNQETHNNSSIVSTIPETQELITNMVTYFLFTEVTSPEDKLQGELQTSSHNPLAYSVSEHIMSHLKSQTVLENEIFLDNVEKEAKFLNFKNNIISNLTKIISEKIRTELKIFKIESSRDSILGTKTNKRPERRM